MSEHKIEEIKFNLFIYSEGSLGLLYFFKQNSKKKVFTGFDMKIAFIYLLIIIHLLLPS